MSNQTQKFLARVATRRIAKDLRDRGRTAGAHVTSGGITSPTLTGCCPNSENKNAEPSRTTMTFTQSYASGPTGRCTAEVRANSGANWPCSLLGFSADMSGGLMSGTGLRQAAPWW